jgi:hypothetical protein
MAYNVFKRPMFKRGGSTTGTGIMSHVEPRVKAAFGFPNFGVSQSNVDPITGKTAYQTMLENRGSTGSNLNIQDIFKKMDPRYPSVYTEPRTVEDFYKEKGDKLKESSEFFKTSPEYKKQFETKTITDGIRGSGGITSLDEIARINMETKQAENLAEKEKLLTDKEVVKDKPAYEGTDIKSEVENESKMIRELLKDEQYSKGELALLVAGALKEPGGIAEKLDKARELALPVARKRREEDKAITLAAYKLAKEKEQQQIKAGTTPKEIRILEAGARAEAERTGGDYEEILRDRLARFGGLDETMQRAVASMYSGSGQIFDLVNTIKGARTRRAEAAAAGKNTDKIDREIAELMSEFETYKSAKGFEEAFPQLKNFKEGGRVNRAMGSDEDGETSDLISSQVSFTPETTTKDSISNETVVEKPVENLTFTELRDRLPPEITDDVVQMLSSSEEALQDFAYIRTQDDVNQFNVKYGVNLVIPPTQA